MTSNGAINLETTIIFSWIKAGSLVLDLGCGDGELLYKLMREKKCRVQGIEIDEKSIYNCVAKGVNALQGDIDSGLADYGDKSFDYVILNESFQQVKKPDTVLQEAFRIGKEVIVSFPNFAYFPARLQIFFRGKTPVTPSLPYEWHDTPNLHFLSVRDFVEFCRARDIKILETAFRGSTRRIKFFPNLLASTGVFRLSNVNKGG